MRKLDMYTAIRYMGIYGGTLKFDSNNNLYDLFDRHGMIIAIVYPLYNLFNRPGMVIAIVHPD